MVLVDELEREHELIESALGALRTYVSRRTAALVDAADAEHFAAFFQRWSGDYHHAREEQVLFEALIREAELPRDRGPIASLTQQHHAMAKTLEALLAQLSAPLPDADSCARLQELAVGYSHALWRHIDAENSVLFPECRIRLRAAGVQELVGRAPTAEELSARDAGLELVARYPPMNDPTALRGDGCVVCPSFGNPCEGVEREWWTESEWEEFPDRLR